jgi:hypothetical protein
MFADGVALELWEVFEALFRKEDKRTGRLLVACVTSSIAPNASTAGTATPHAVSVKGKNFVSGASMKFGTETRHAELVNEQELRITPEPDGAREKPLQVIVPNGDASNVVTFHISEQGAGKNFGAE